MSRPKGGRKSRRKTGARAGGGGVLARLGSLARALVVTGEDEEPAAHAQEIKGLLLIGFGLWLLVSLATYHSPHDAAAPASANLGGQLGAYLAHSGFIVAGLGAFLFGALSVAWGCVLIARKRVPWPAVRILGGLSFAIAMGFILHMALGADVPWSNRLPYGVGGYLAEGAAPELQRKFGPAGLWIVMIVLALVSFMLATEMAFYPALTALREWAAERRAERGESLGAALAGWGRTMLTGLWDFVRGNGIDVELVPAPRPPRVRAPKPPALLDAPEDEEEDDEPELDEAEEESEEADEEEEEEDLPDVVSAKAALPTRAAPLRGPVVRELPYDPPTPPPGPWTLPPLTLLEPPERDAVFDEERLEAAARKLEQALGSFRVEAQVVGAQVGPTVILFELEVTQGTRLNKVTQLSQEIAATLRAQSVRVIAPIPGKSTIGIEVPNESRRKVRISELVSLNAYDKKFAALPIFLGMDAEGKAIVEDLARMPHLLIAGTTGSGKSVCINTILASLLLTRSPHDVKLILIDPKMVELQAFSTIPHLMCPVVTDMRTATNVLLWAVEKMEGRYDLFNRASVKNIKSYNALGEDELKLRFGDEWSDERTPRHVPYIVVVIDEFADLMMASKKEAEQAITRLAQKSRAVGIHVILATQRPSTDVITGVIKGNLPTRIAFKVASKVDSRVILDCMGADKLLGSGDMLYNPPQSSHISRAQGALVEDHEIKALVDFVCKEAAPNFSQELVQTASGDRPGAGAGLESALEDDLWDEAVRVVLKTKRGSASLLQRALGIGYTRASRLLDMMSEAGITSAHKGSKAREVLLTLEQWEAQHGAPLGQAGGQGDEA